jgi:hydroxymethylbilane synthase
MTNTRPMPIPQTPHTWRAATRKSPLALWQTSSVCAQLQNLYPQHQFEQHPLSTRGDEVLDRSLSKIGGKGLFIKELEHALLAHEADFAVHSLKDVPVDLNPRFCLPAMLKREDPRDAFVSIHYAHPRDLPVGACVGTSSLRRVMQLQRNYPHLTFLPLRGNINTRINKLINGEFNAEFDAIVLAHAGLLRLGLTEHIKHVFSIEEMLPAPGQGALVIECLSDRADVQQLLVPLHDSITASTVMAERYVSEGLGGSCSTPLGAHAWIDAQHHFHLVACLGDGKNDTKAHYLQAQAHMASDTISLSDCAKDLAQKVLTDLNQQGAVALLRCLATQSINI